MFTLCSPRWFSLLGIIVLPYMGIHRTTYPAKTALFIYISAQIGGDFTTCYMSLQISYQCFGFGIITAYIWNVQATQYVTFNLNVNFAAVQRAKCCTLDLYCFTQTVVMTHESNTFSMSVSFVFSWLYGCGPTLCNDTSGVQHRTSTAFMWCH